MGETKLFPINKSKFYAEVHDTEFGHDLVSTMGKNDFVRAETKKLLDLEMRHDDPTAPTRVSIFVVDGESCNDLPIASKTIIFANQTWHETSDFDAILKLYTNGSNYSKSDIQFNYMLLIVELAVCHVPESVQFITNHKDLLINTELSRIILGQLLKTIFDNPLDVCIVLEKNEHAVGLFNLLGVFDHSEKSNSPVVLFNNTQ